MEITKDDLQYIDQQPLTDVLSINGYTWSSITASQALYVCPFHGDHNPSFSVQRVAAFHPESNKPYPVMAFRCFKDGCVNGYGALALHSRLTGMTDPSDLYNVARNLAANLHLELPSRTCVNDSFSNRVKNVSPVDEITYEYAEWSDTNLHSLGCVTTPVTVKETTEENGVEVEQIVSLTDKDGNIKFKTSWDQRNADGTIKPLDTKELTELFGIRPVESFITPASKRTNANGTTERISYRYEYVKGYPVFDIHYEDEKGWYSKRYEPYFRPYIRKDGKKVENYKFTWWFKGNKKRDKELSGNLYGDKDVMQALKNLDEQPSTSCPLHPVSTITIKNDKGEDETIVKFTRVIICSGPRDAINVWYHSNAHVVYPHSEGVEISAQMISSLRKIAHEIFVLYDIDRTGTERSEQLCMRFMDLRLIKLPQELSLITSTRSKKPCKDASEYFHYFESMKKYFDNPADYRGMNVNVHFERLISSSKTMRFVQSEPHFRAKTHELFYKYQIDIASMLQFLYARGMQRASDEIGYDFVIIRKNIVDGLYAKEAVVKAREMMISFMESRPEYTQDMSNAISTSNRITIEILMQLPAMTLNMKSWGADWRYIFYSNTAVYADKNSRKEVPYDAIKCGVFRNAIKPFPYRRIKELGYERMVNPQYDRYKVDHLAKLRGMTRVEMMDENKKWTSWERIHRFLLNLNKSVNEMPETFQFLWDTCNMFTYKELAGVDLTEEEKQIQVAHFIVKMLNFGYLQSPYRTSSQIQMVLAMDYFRQHKDANNGRSGKSLFIPLLGLTTNVFVVKGREFKTGDNMGKNFTGFIPYVHTLIAIDDLMNKFMFDTLFNTTESLTIKELYKNEKVIPKDISPKLFITMNNRINDKDPSTVGRVRPQYNGEYYHQGTVGGEIETVSPLTKFGHDILETPDEKELERIKKTDEERYWRIINELAWGENFMIDCYQFYLEFQDQVHPPVHEDADASSDLDPVFAEWANKFFAIDEHFTVWIPVCEMIYSYLSYRGNPIGKGKITLPDNMLSRISDNSRSFRAMLDAYCTLHHITNTPKHLIGSKSDAEKGYRRAKHWVTKFDKFGRAEYPHQLVQSVNANGEDRAIPCRIFYRVEDTIPEHFTQCKPIPRETPEDPDWLMIESE